MATTNQQTQYYTHQMEITLILALHFFTERNKDIDFIVIHQNLLVPGYHSDSKIKAVEGEKTCMMHSNAEGWLFNILFPFAVVLCISFKSGMFRECVCRQKSRHFALPLVTLAMHL